MKRYRGVQDLFDRNGLQWKNVAAELIKHNVPGNWHRPQNVYNLVKGFISPKDAYVYVVLSKMFNVDISIILNRYSAVGLNKFQLGAYEALEESLEMNDSLYSVDDEDDLF
jgi:hypothetical protein